MRVLGTNPENMFSHLFEIQQARLKRLNNPAAEADFAGRRRALENELSEILGYNSIPANSAIARAGATIRAVEGMTKLGGAVISSFNDVGNAAMELRYQGMNLMDAMGKSIAGKLKGYSAADQKEILGYMGIFTDSVRDEMIAKFSGDTSVPGRISRLQRTFFKLNLLNWWTENSRKSMGLVMSNWMARNSKSSWAALNEDLRRVLNSSGITEREWNLYRGMEMDSVRGNQHMTPMALNTFLMSVSLNILPPMDSKSISPALLRRASLWKVNYAGIILIGCSLPCQSLAPEPAQ